MAKWQLTSSIAQTKERLKFNHNKTIATASIFITEEW